MHTEILICRGDDGPTVEYTDNIVTVPETNFPLNTEQLQILSQAINPVRDSENFGINLFLETKDSLANVGTSLKHCLFFALYNQSKYHIH